MKKIETILSELGIELTEEQNAVIVKSIPENYKTIDEWQEQIDKVENLEEKITITEEALKKFEGVDLEELKAQVVALNGDLEKKEAEYKERIADRDFNDILKEGISSVKGKNPKAIAALLDMDVLKASKNQKEDIQTALKALTEAEDSKMLFGEPEAQVIGTGNLIGAVTKTPAQQADTLKSAIAEHYNS